MEAAGALQSGELTARELVQGIIRGIEGAKHLNAYVGGVSSAALSHADESDRRVKLLGETVSPSSLEIRDVVLQKMLLC